MRDPPVCRHAHTSRHGCRGIKDMQDPRSRTIGAHTLYRSILCDDLPEYMFLVSIPFYLDLRDHG